MDASQSFDPNASRASRYDLLELQCPGLLDEPDAVANQANFSAAVHAAFGWHWVGFYRVVGDELVLGPFQGPVACTRLRKGKGVCAAAWEDNAPVRVPDVEAFPGHVACSPLSRSEIVLPVRDAAGRVAAVLDIDSAVTDDFSEEDERRLMRLVEAHSARFLPPTE